eukprot:8835958-Pyramimonas_sp.AAC.1
MCTIYLHEDYGAYSVDHSGKSAILPLNAARSLSTHPRARAHRLDEGAGVGEVEKAGVEHPLHGAQRGHRHDEGGRVHIAVGGAGQHHHRLRCVHLARPCPPVGSVPRVVGAVRSLLSS